MATGLDTSFKIMKTLFTKVLSVGAVATLLPAALNADFVFSEDFSQNQRGLYQRADTWQSPGESAWNIVDEEMRMVNTEGTTAFMHTELTLSEVGHFAQIDYRFDDAGPGYGRGTGLFLNDTLNPLGTGGVEVGMVVQGSEFSNNDRFQVAGDEFTDFDVNTNEDWSTLQVELVSINGSDATFNVNVTGRYSFTGSFQRAVGQYVGFYQYNGDGVNIRQDNFEMTAIPEPATTAIFMGAGVLGLVFFVSRRRKQRAAVA